MKRLVIDTPNLLFRVHSANQAQKSDDEELNAGLAMHMCFRTVLSHYKKHKPDQIAFAFEGRNNWRKQYTKSEKCVSKRLYKGNRVYTASNEIFFQLIDSFKNFLKLHTTAVVLNAEEVEGDDLIGGFVKRFSAEGDEIVILSGDKDFTQLLKYPNVRLINPDKGKERTCDDPLYFMFEKCIRGDGGDNVMSAYPRVRSTRIEKAYKDDYERANLMNEKWTVKDPETGEILQEFVVGELFEENKLLMDLDAQPPEIKEIIENAIDAAIQSRASFSYFHFMKFLGEYELKAIADESMNYNDIFSLHENKRDLKKPKTSSLISF